MKEKREGKNRKWSELGWRPADCDREGGREGNIFPAKCSGKLREDLRFLPLPPPLSLSFSHSLSLRLSGSANEQD